jgi:purine-binding chemotaxis protein CheW
MSVSLSEVAGDPAKEKSEIQLVVFTLAGCELAVEIHEVREIIRISEITLMPKAPKLVEGIINLRGRIFPVLDLKKRFEMPLVEKTAETRILVVEKKDQVVGLLVDKVVEVIKVPPASIEPWAQPVLTIEGEFIKGLLTPRDRLIVFFRLEKVFSLEGLKALKEFEKASQGEGKKLGH